jgi:hypothetical protein
VISDRCAFALAHPVNDPAGATDPVYRRLEPQPDGNLLLTVLAVDR